MAQPDRTPTHLARPVVLAAPHGACGATIFIVRMFTGWGLVTNLNDNYGWGLWKGFNTLVGIALGASGFTTAFAVYVLGQREVPAGRPDGRSRRNTGLLLFRLVPADRPRTPGADHPSHRLLEPESPLFEVAWCVMLY